MNVLPNALLLKIFGHCDQETLYTLSNLCRRSRGLLKQNTRTIRGFLPLLSLHVNFDNEGVNLLRARLPPNGVDLLTSNTFDICKLDERKRIEWSDETAKIIWDHIWYLQPRTIAIRIKDKRYKEIMKKMPDSWLARTSKIHLFTFIPCDILSILRKCKECYNFVLEVVECDSDVNTLLKAVKKVRNFVLKGNVKNLNCDDTTLDLLTVKSKNDPIGLENFWIFGCSHRYSLEKIKWFLKNANFSPNVIMYLGSIEGKQADFMAFLEEENADQRYIASDIYNFKMNNIIFNINIDNFIE